MNDLQHVGTFFLIFAFVLACYSAILVKTGDKELLPYRAMYTVRNKEDVRHVGRITLVVALVIGALALLLRIFASI